jgi:N-acetylmuramoyl-L-alanine amidase
LIRLNHILVVILWIVFIFPVAASDFVLVIDPGHGGKDPGARGKKGKEKDINLAVAKLAGQYIAGEHPDLKIVYTRNKDVFIGLNERADIANRVNANLFISIHANAVSKKKSNIKGAEVFTFGVTRIEENLEVAKMENSVILLEDNYEQKYEGFDPNSAESYIIFEFMMNQYADQSINFASMVQKELVSTSKRYNRGVKQAGYLVLRKSTMPRILIELDFISNPESESYLLSAAGQKSMARAIGNAFTEYKKEFDRKEKSSTQEGVVEQPAKALPENRQLPNPTEQITVSENRPAEPVKKVSSNRIYKVQILASVKKLAAKSSELKGYKADCFVEGKYYKYTCGESSDWNEIEKLRQKIAKDFKGAFIVAFENGVKMPVNN